MSERGHISDLSIDLSIAPMRINNNNNTSSSSGLSLSLSD